MVSLTELFLFIKMQFRQNPFHVRLYRLKGNDDYEFIKYRQRRHNFFVEIRYNVRYKKVREPPKNVSYIFG